MGYATLKTRQDLRDSLIALGWEIEFDNGCSCYLRGGLTRVRISDHSPNYNRGQKADAHIVVSEGEEDLPRGLWVKNGDFCAPWREMTPDQAVQAANGAHQITGLDAPHRDWTPSDVFDFNFA